MKIRRGFFLFCILVTSLLAANPPEEEEHPIKYGIIFPNEDTFRAIKSQGITCDKTTGEVTIALSSVESARQLKTTGMFVHGSTSRQYNKLLLVTFKPDLDFAGITEEAYSLNGEKFGGVDTKSLSDVMQNHAAYFEQPARKSFLRSVKDTYGVRNRTVVFDQGVNDFVVEEAVSAVPIGRPAPAPDLDASLNFCIDEANQTVSTYFGRKTDEKFSNQKYLVFAAYDLTGHLLNTCEVTFPFPRAYKTSFPVRSRSNPSESVGTVFIFERQMFFGKQFNDPEKNNYEVVVCDPQGKLLLYKTCKIGDAKRSGFEPYCMMADGDKFQLFGHFMGGKGEGLIVKTLSADGSETSKEVLRAEMKTKRVNEKHPVGKRRSYDDLGITFAPFEKFACMGHVITGNGDLLIWGRVTTETDDPNYKADASQAIAPKAPQVTQYADLACLQFTPANELVAIYGVLLNDAIEPGPITVSTVNGSIIFAIAEPKRPLSEVEGQLFSIPSLSSDGVTRAYPYKQLYRPKFAVLTLSTMKLVTHVPTNERLTLFNPEKFSFVSGERSVIYYFGYSISRKNPEMRVWVDAFGY